MCVTTTDMKERFCKVLECNNKCNYDDGADDSSIVLRECESKDICSYNNLTNNCDGNNNHVISHKSRRKNYILRFVGFDFLLIIFVNVPS